MRMKSLAEVEREHILVTLAALGGNRTKAAEVLGISIRCLRMKLAQYRQAAEIFEAELRRRQELEAIQE